LFKILENSLIAYEQKPVEGGWSELSILAQRSQLVLIECSACELFLEGFLFVFLEPQWQFLLEALKQ
jgi:hypothetical protein